MRVNNFKNVVICLCSIIANNSPISRMFYVCGRALGSDFGCVNYP